MNLTTKKNIKNELINSVKEISMLEKNWNQYNADPISKSVINRSYVFIEMIFDNDFIISETDPELFSVSSRFHSV